MSGSESPAARATSRKSARARERYRFDPLGAHPRHEGPEPVFDPERIDRRPGEGGALKSAPEELANDVPESITWRSPGYLSKRRGSSVGPLSLIRCVRTHLRSPVDPDV